MRPFSPVPFTSCRSISSSRASRRTEGEAWTSVKSGMPATGNTRSGMSTPLPPPPGWGLAPPDEPDEDCFFGASSFFAPPPPPPEDEPPPSPVSIVMMTVPSDTLSPTETLSVLMVPERGAGTSIAALSDSSVTSGSSAETESPSATWTSMTGTSSKSPMSGTSISTTAPPPPPPPEAPPPDAASSFSPSSRSP